MLNPGRALWYALKVDDFELADFLISQNADVRQTYEYEPKKYYCTASLMVLKTCQARSKGLQSSHYQNLLRIFQNFLCLAQECDLRCHCSKNYEHRCPLYVALKSLNVQKEEQLGEKKNLVVRMLLLKGATIRPLMGKVLDVEGYRQYLFQKTRQQQSNGFDQQCTFGQNGQQSQNGFHGGQATFSKPN